jgi:hypothetical protein
VSLPFRVSTGVIRRRLLKTLFVLLMKDFLAFVEALPYFRRAAMELMEFMRFVCWKVDSRDGGVNDVQTTVSRLAS